MNKIAEKFYDLIEMHYLKEFTRDLGKIEILDDRINCYVDNAKLKQYLIDHKNYLMLGREYKSKKEMEVLENIEKPIYFIIENMKFSSNLEIYGSMCSIEFKKCIFKHSLRFNNLENMVFKDNRFYNDDRPISYIFKSKIYNIEFINNDFYFIHNEKNPYLTEVDMEIRAKNIKLINFIFHNPKIIFGLWFFSQNIDISNSELYGNYLLLNSDNIKRSNNKFCFNKVKIMETNNNHNKLNISDIDAPLIIYNDIKILKDENGKYYIDSVEEECSKIKIYKKN